jgi:hypothetical protein
MDIEFWVDPICPWCWVTARWVVDEVAPSRDLNVTWRPISLLVKNNTSEDSPFYDKVTQTYKMLRVMEAVRASEGDAPLQKLYLAFGSRIHHEREVFFPMADALKDAGLDEAFAAAADEDKWDEPLLRYHNDGLALVGEDVGTPIIAMANDDGERVGIFGPVITRVPPTKLSLKLWDGIVACMQVPGFWELKKTRTERPDVGAAPEL